MPSTHTCRLRVFLTVDFELWCAGHTTNACSMLPALRDASGCGILVVVQRPSPLSIRPLLGEQNRLSIVQASKHSSHLSYRSSEDHHRLALAIFDTSHAQPVTTRSWLTNLATWFTPCSAACLPDAICRPGSSFCLSIYLSFILFRIRGNCYV